MTSQLNHAMHIQLFWACNLNWNFNDEYHLFSMFWTSSGNFHDQTKSRPRMKDKQKENQQHSDGGGLG